MAMPASSVKKNLFKKCVFEIFLRKKGEKLGGSSKREKKIDLLLY